MADDKKKKKPSKSGSGGGDGMLWIIIIIIFLLVAVLGFSKPFNPTFLNVEYFFGRILPFFNVVRDFITNSHTWEVVAIVSSVLSILFIGVIIYSLVRMREIQIHEKKELDHEIKEALARDAEAEREHNPRWRYITNLIESPNESDWRIAIIEADNMLEEALGERGYEGDSIGEKLKGASVNSFPTLQSAWDAHNFRNKIAHEGIDFPISQIETRRVVRMYQNVFEELNVI